MSQIIINKLLVAIGISTSCIAPAKANETTDKLIEIGQFFQGANIVSGPTIVDCKLSGGTQTKCFQMVVKPEPTNYVAGPWCPSNVNDGPDVSGIWLKDGKVYDADGKFFSQLATLYDDQKWSMVVPETGAIKVTDTKEKCAAAARPDVGPEYANYCVQCLPEYMDSNATVTYTIPMEQFDLASGADNRDAGSGIAANGIRLDAPAPVDAITGAYTIAPFDDCGGHVNLHVGYHYHAATSCQDEAGIKGPTATQIGIAMDGYPIMSNKLNDGTQPADLDACNGRIDEDGNYRYYAGDAGSNAILGCLKAEYGCVSEEAGVACDASVRRGPPGGEPPRDANGNILPPPDGAPKPE